MTFFFLEVMKRHDNENGLYLIGIHTQTYVVNKVKKPDKQIVTCFLTELMTSKYYLRL